VISALVAGINHLNGLFAAKGYEEIPATHVIKIHVWLLFFYFVPGKNERLLNARKGNRYQRTDLRNSGVEGSKNC